jgi:hypothetical protein
LVPLPIFLGVPCINITLLVAEGKIEAIETTARRRICLNSLVEFLEAEKQKAEAHAASSHTIATAF